MCDRELLQQALEALTAYRELLYQKTNGCAFAAPCAPELAIEAALSRSEWVPVAERLPVVPEGKFSVRIWAFRADKGKVFRANWWQHHGYQKINFTHWMYRQDDTPAPPRSES
mgnify:CR=1 FL=1